MYGPTRGRLSPARPSANWLVVTHNIPRVASEASPRIREGIQMFKTLIVAALVFIIGTFPATWLLMLFLGNVGANVSYWGALPLGILVSALLGSAGASR